MTRFLPQRDVKVRADRTGPARLTATERRALRSVKDEALRRVLGEMMLRSRDVQENFEAIEGLFPIQPENVANALREPEEEEESVKRGDLQIITFTWAKGAGTNLQKLITQEFEPTHALLFAIANGSLGATISAGGTYAGVALANTMSDLTGTRPAVSAHTSNMTAGQSLGAGPGPRRLVLNRTAEANTKNSLEIALVLIRAAQSLASSGGANGNTESGAGVLSIATTASTLITELMPAIYTRASAKLPTARSATPIIEKEVEYGAEGKKGTAGAQILVPTLAEREAEGKPTISWTFPDPGATAERRIYETEIRLL